MRMNFSSFLLIGLLAMNQAYAQDIEIPYEPVAEEPEQTLEDLYEAQEAEPLKSYQVELEDQDESEQAPRDLDSPETSPS